MSKKKLKLQNKDLEISVVDILNTLDPSATGKFTPFLIKMLRNEMSRHKLRKLRSNSILDPTNILEHQVISHVINLLGNDNINVIKSFAKHLEENRIPENKRDINQYQNWDDLNKEVTLANLKQNQKRLEKEVLKVLETDEWLVIKPLTLESSLTYGSGTKWCTAMRNNPKYFYRYSINGVLTYIINKKSGDKYGIMYDKNTSEFSIWDAIDKRIDSIESNIPSEIIKTIFTMSKSDKPNWEYFSEEEKIKSKIKSKKNNIEYQAIPINQEVRNVNEVDGDVEVEITPEYAIEILSEEMNPEVGYFYDSYVENN